MSIAMGAAGHNTGYWPHTAFAAALPQVRNAVGSANAGSFLLPRGENLMVRSFLSLSALTNR